MSCKFGLFVVALALTAGQLQAADGLDAEGQALVQRINEDVSFTLRIMRLEHFRESIL